LRLFVIDEVSAFTDILEYVSVFDGFEDFSGLGSHGEKEKIGPKKFLDDVSSSVLEEIFKDMEIDKPSSKSKYAETLIDESEIWGLEKILISLSLSKLKEIVKACGLKVESGSIDILVDCIVKQENHKAPKKKVQNKRRLAKRNPISRRVFQKPISIHIITAWNLRIIVKKTI